MVFQQNALLALLTYWGYDSWFEFWKFSDSLRLIANISNIIRIIGTYPTEVDYRKVNIWRKDWTHFQRLKKVANEINIKWVKRFLGCPPCKLKQCWNVPGKEEFKIRLQQRSWWQCLWSRMISGKWIVKIFVKMGQNSAEDHYYFITHHYNTLI